MASEPVNYSCPVCSNRLRAITGLPEEMEIFFCTHLNCGDVFTYSDAGVMLILEELKFNQEGR